MSTVASKLENFRRRAISSTGPSGEVIPLPRSSPSYDLNLATLASKVLYRSGRDPTGSGGPLLILCAAAFPDTRQVDYNKLLPYVLSELPGDEELSAGIGYSVVFFAGGGGERVGSDTGTEGENTQKSGGRWNRPAWSWSLQAYNLLSRAVRKNIKKLWIVHERAWVRVLFEAAQTVVSPKFKKKVVHVNSLSELATFLPLRVLNIPPAVYLHDRKINPKIAIPNPPPPVFGEPPFPPGELEPKLPLVLIESSHYLKSNHLKTEGIFRVSCSMQLLEVVREAYDRQQYLRLFDYGPHVSAGLIKLYYRSLPEPLISKRYYNYLNEKCKTPEGFKTLLSAHQREGGLPYPSRVLLTRHLFPLLSVIAQYQAVNKMTPENLAICVSPSLVRSEDPLVDIGISRGPVCQLVKWGIENIDQFSKRPVRPGNRELNIKKGPEKLIILSDDDEKEVEEGKIEKAVGETKKPDNVELASPVVPRPEAVKSVEKEKSVEGKSVEEKSIEENLTAPKLGAVKSTEEKIVEQSLVAPKPGAIKSIGEMNVEESPVASKPEAVKSIGEKGGRENPVPERKNTNKSQSQPAPPISPIEGIPLSLQPALQPTDLITPPSEEYYIPPPLSERPTPYISPTTSSIQAALLPSISTSTEGTASSAVPPIPRTQSPDSISPGSAQVNTRRPSHSSPFMAKIDIDSSAVAKNVAKFQALAEAASMTPPLLPVRRASTVSGTLMTGWVADQSQEAPVLENSSGIRTWRTQQVEHLKLPLGQREGGEGVGVGVKGRAGFGGRGLHKARSELDLGGGRSVVKADLGMRVGVAEVAKGSSNSGTIGNKLNKSHNNTTISAKSIPPTTSTSFSFSTTEKRSLGPIPPVKPLALRKARSTIDFRSSSSSSSSLFSPTPATNAADSRRPGLLPPLPPGRAHTTGRLGGSSGGGGVNVEELKKLFEERVQGVKVLAQIGKGRRGSNIVVAPGGGVGGGGGEGLVRPIPE